MRGRSGKLLRCVDGPSATPKSTDTRFGHANFDDDDEAENCNVDEFKVAQSDGWRIEQCSGVVKVVAKIGEKDGE